MSEIHTGPGESVDKSLIRSLANRVAALESAILPPRAAAPFPFPRNLAAYTPPEPNYPPFVSINETAPGLVAISVRSRIQDNGMPGALASIEMPSEVFSGLVRDILASR